MRVNLLSVLSVLVLILFAGFSQAQSLERPNLIWARTTGDAITLDGHLNEAAWAGAETFRMEYGTNDQYIPGSGYRDEAGVSPSDPTDATFKFLVKDNYLYMGVTVMDSSVGGGLFNRFDGFLMNLRDHRHIAGCGLHGRVHVQSDLARLRCDQIRGRHC